jgi:hypothetical protein
MPPVGGAGPSRAAARRGRRVRRRPARALARARARGRPPAAATAGAGGLRGWPLETGPLSRKRAGIGELGGGTPPGAGARRPRGACPLDGIKRRTVGSLGDKRGGGRGSGGARRGCARIAYAARRGGARARPRARPPPRGCEAGAGNAPAAVSPGGCRNGRAEGLALCLCGAAPAWGAAHAVCLRFAARPAPRPPGGGCAGRPARRRVRLPAHRIGRWGRVTTHCGCKLQAASPAQPRVTHWRTYDTTCSSSGAA